MTRVKDKSRFLVLYDYGQGGIWAFVWARGPREINETFRDLTIIEEQPEWMDASDVDRIEKTMSFDIDSIAPSDWIARLLRVRGSA
jgi:hypothetical protein